MAFLTTERRVWLFTLGALLLFVMLVFFSARRQGWFAPKNRYVVIFRDADGLHPGAPVTLMGLKVGVVEKVDINEARKVEVTIKVQRKYAKYLREDSRLVMARPFILAEKEILIQAGSDKSPMLAEGAYVQGEAALELTDLLGGNKMMPYLVTLEKLFEQIRLLMDTQSDKSPSLVRMYSQVHKSLAAVELLQKDLHQIRTEVLTSDDTKTAIRELAAALPTIKALSQDATRIMPELQQTLGSTITTLEAMQRSFLFRGGVESYREDLKRAPASQ
jgi:phospholipid/cholesterol/gamma-HCH transport system substrate-binding protein